MGCHPTDVLRDEHRLILEVVGALERFLDAGLDEGALDQARDFVDFFSLYTDALHHGKEEAVLFEALVEQGFSINEGPVGMMLEEHYLGRALVRQMADVIAHAQPGSQAAHRELERVGRDYIELLRQHIEKEDGALFEMADSALDELACRKVCDAYEKVCAGKFRGRTMAQLEELAGTLIARYPE